MSELKVYDIDLDYPYNENNGSYYLKSEADKVIAELNDKANYNEYAYKHKSEELANTCRFYEDELRHHKWKRCLAMAKWCDMAATQCLIKQTLLLGSCAKDRFDWLQVRFTLYSRWHKRWLDIAEKLKEAK